MITRRNLIWLLPLFIIITFPIWKIPVGSFLSPRGGYDPKFFKKTMNERNFSMVKVNILQSENGEKTADIRAAKALSSKRPHAYILRRVNADVIGEDGKTTNIVAKRGFYDSFNRHLKLVRKVVVTNKEDNFTLKTDLLYYFDTERKVHCPGITHFKGEGIRIRGGSFDYDILRGFYDVGGRVSCTLTGYTAP